MLQLLADPVCSSAKTNLSACIILQYVMNTEITLTDLTVAEIMRRWPVTITVFLAHRLDCLGCSMADFETVSDAIQVYHLPHQQFLQELQNSILAAGDIEPIALERTE